MLALQKRNININKFVSANQQAGNEARHRSRSPGLREVTLVPDLSHAALEEITHVLMLALLTDPLFSFAQAHSTASHSSNSEDTEM